jgi:SAM-dependent methyltransferase
MEILWIIFCSFLLLFTVVLFFGAPYLPTLRPQIQTAFELLDMKPGQTLLELGCGDGKVLLAAAQAGYTVIGIELNPVLVLIARLRTRKYHDQVRIIWGDFWRTPWPQSDGVFVFLLDRFMPKLEDKMRVYKRPLASVTFKIPGKTVLREQNGVFLYRF